MKRAFVIGCLMSIPLCGAAAQDVIFNVGPIQRDMGLEKQWVTVQVQNRRAGGKFPRDGAIVGCQWLDERGNVMRKFGGGAISSVPSFKFTDTLTGTAYASSVRCQASGAKAQKVQSPGATVRSLKDSPFNQP